MKKLLSVLLVTMMLLAACAGPTETETTTPVPAVTTPAPVENAAAIDLSDDGITVDGTPISEDPAAPVYAAHDIVYYEEGRDFTYGEGGAEDAHSAQEAAAHTVIHIAKAGTYALSGTLSQGQIAVDLGKEAKDDPTAIVTLVLDGVDITCSVAPAVIFYNVYECGSTDTETAAKDVNTWAAGANVIIKDGTENTVNGSYVARIYKPDSVELNEEKTEVLDAKKLHKYDAAFYSKMSMNLYGEAENTGNLYINAENEGLDSELHLTLNGGNIFITAGNDGINTNEDGVSVTTVNGGRLEILVTGETGEGDGIDSNGWLVINGGTVITAACGSSMDGGIDSDMGIHILGGTVMAAGHMLDAIEAGGQPYAVFEFAGNKSGGSTANLMDSTGKTVLSASPKNAYSILIFSSPELTPGNYTLTVDGVKQQGIVGTMGGMTFPGGMGGQRPGGFDPGTMGGQMPEGFDPGAMGGQMPEGFDPGAMGDRMPEGFDPGAMGGQMPEGFDPGAMGGQRPGGFTPGGTNPGEMFRPGGMNPGTGDTTGLSEIFTVAAEGSVFRNVTDV